MTETTRLYILVPVLATLTFIQGHRVMRKPKHMWSFFYKNSQSIEMEFGVLLRYLNLLMVIVDSC